MYEAYPETHLHDGQTLTSASCTTGLMFESLWDDGYGNGLGDGGFGEYQFTLVDQVKVPDGLAPGHYALLALGLRADAPSLELLRRHEKRRLNEVAPCPEHRPPRRPLSRPGRPRR